MKDIKDVEMMGIKIDDIIKTTAGRHRRVCRIKKSRDGIDIGIEVVGGDLDGMFCGYIGLDQIVRE